MKIRKTQTQDSKRHLPWNKSLKPTVTRVTPFAAKGKARATLRQLRTMVLCIISKSVIGLILLKWNDRNNEYIQWLARIE